MVVSKYLKQSWLSREVLSGSLNYSNILNFDLTDSRSSGRVIGADESSAETALEFRELGGR